MSPNSQFRRRLFYIALAAPMVLLPQFDYVGLNRERFSLGFPPTMDILLGGIDDGHILHFQPNPALNPVLLLSVLGWSFVASLAWRLRIWAVKRPDWLGAIVQASLTASYCVLMFFFFYGVIQLIWSWRLFPMEMPALKRACAFGLLWLPYLYALGAGAILVALYLDARPRPAIQRIPHFAFACCFIVAFYLASPILGFQLDEFQFTIQDQHDSPFDRQG